MVSFIGACVRVGSIGVALSIGFAGCAPLVDMDEPSPQGPRISDLRFVPSGTRARCSVRAEFRFEAAGEEIVSAKCAWVRRSGRSGERGYLPLVVDLDAIRDKRAGVIVAVLTPERSGTYYYYLQVGDRSGRMSNVLRGTLIVDRWWGDPPPCPAAEWGGASLLDFLDAHRVYRETALEHLRAPGNFWSALYQLETVGGGAREN